MRVNIIGNTNSNVGLAQDTHIIHAMIVNAFGKETTVRHVPHFYPQCEEAEINFFIELINPALFHYASKNIWIPNPEWAYQTWKPYGKMLDEIWVKTYEAEELFKDWGKVRYIGWTSIDKVVGEKDYSQAIIPVGKNVWRHPKPIVQAYMWIKKNSPELYQALPTAHLVYHSMELPAIPEVVQDKFVVHSERLSESEYDKLLQKCGLAMCTSAAEGFCHAVNEAMSTECMLLLSPINPFLEMTKNALWVSTTKSTPHPTCLGTLEDVSVESIVESLTLYVTMNHHAKRVESRANRERYEQRHETFVKLCTDVVKSIEFETYSIEKNLPKEEDLPKVSIITLTRDRRAFFPLAKYCMVAQTYPEDKIEWVIVDDGTDQIKDLVSELTNVKYVLVDEPLSIGAKRNLAVQSASHDILVMMDDDDVYPNNSILTRVAHMLAGPAKECLFSTVIPCYQIHEHKSFMNVPPITLPQSERVSEATLCFTRKFWEDRKFPDQQIGEGDAFIRGREQMCREFSPQDVIVSLIHKKNTSSRKPPAMESNGCHYGFSDELFTLVSEIAERI
jgi:hypothetical protein